MRLASQCEARCSRSRLTWSGNLGTAILRGIITSQKHDDLSSGDITTPSRFIACVKDGHSAMRLEKEFSNPAGEVTVLTNQNVRGVQLADIIILGCEPSALDQVMGASGMVQALAGKLLLSILAGVTAKKIRDSMESGSTSSPPCTIVQVLPNVAARIGESMSVIATPDVPLSDAQSTLVKWIFSRIGSVTEMEQKQMDVATAVAGSGPAFVAIMIEAMSDGAVAMGVPRSDAQLMVAQVFAGAAKMVLDGTHPALLKDRVTTPGGCTIAGLGVMEEAGIRGTLSRTIREATTVVGLLGQGVEKPNRTRFPPR